MHRAISIFIFVISLRFFHKQPNRLVRWNCLSTERVFVYSFKNFEPVFQFFKVNSESFAFRG
jgi:hypothetical protein